MKKTKYNLGEFEFFDHIDRSKIEEQKKAVRAGYDIDIIPSDLATHGRDAKSLLKELQSQNERMLLVNEEHIGYIGETAGTADKQENIAETQETELPRQAL